MVPSDHLRSINSAVMAVACQGAAPASERARRWRHSQVLRGVAVRAVLQLLPAAEVRGGAVQQVAVAGRQQLAHQHDEGVDPHHDQVLARPAHVVVLGALWTETRSGGVTAARQHAKESKEFQMAQ